MWSDGNQADILRGLQFGQTRTIRMLKAGMGSGDEGARVLTGYFILGNLSCRQIVIVAIPAILNLTAKHWSSMKTWSKYLG